MIRPGIRRLLRLRAGADATTRELSEELRAHFEARTRQFMSQGMSEADARAEAWRRFGGESAVGALENAAAERDRRLAWHDQLEILGRDLRQSAGSLARDPGFTLVVVLTFALGLGVNAAMFGLVDRLLLSGPAHVRAPAELVRIYRTVNSASGDANTTSLSSYAQFTAIRERAQLLADVGGYDVGERALGRGADAELLQVGSVTAGFLESLGVRPLLGRFFTPAEDEPGDSRRVAVIGYEYWQNRLGGSRAVLGRDVVIDGDVYAVIGVTPGGFTGVGQRLVSAWVPMSSRSSGLGRDWKSNWESRWFYIIGRLRPGATPDAVGAEATAIFRSGYVGPDRHEAAARLWVAPLRHDDEGNEPMQASVARWLWGIAVIVLLIACANIANLQLARSARRRRELAVRLALGISRAGLVRLLLGQSVVLALAGAAFGLVAAHWGGGIVRSLLLPDVDWSGSTVTLRVFLFTASVACVVGLATALLPAMHAARTDLNTALKSGARSVGGIATRTRSALTIAQTALSVVLLIGAGLFLRSLDNVRSIDLGFDADEVIAVTIPWSPMDEVPRAARPAEEERRYAALDALFQRVAAMPDVQSASLSQWSPLYSTMRVTLRVAGWDSVPALRGGGPYLSTVSSRYFETVGTTLLRGRVFTPADAAQTEPVAIVNETMAGTLWPTRDALGACLYVGSGNVPCARIVGVVEDAHRFQIREDPAMQYYLPLGQERQLSGSFRLAKDRGSDGPTLLLRTKPGARLQHSVVRDIVADEMPNPGYIDIARLQDVIDPQVQPWRMGASLFGLFGVLALLIAGIGLYSVIAYMVMSRSNELAMRKALGARTHDLLRLVMGQGTVLAIIAVAVGVLPALLLSRVVRPLLFETSPHDPFTYFITITVLLITALAASLIPALRAARLEPASVLRNE
jgi:predicted permease